MSYILDALKKSSEERQKLDHGEQGQHSSIPATMPRSPRRLRGSFIVLLFMGVVLSIAAGTAGWWYLSPLLNEQSIISRAPEIPLNPVSKTEVTNERPAPNRSKSAKNIESSTQVEAPAVPPREIARPSIPLQQDLPFAIQAAIPDMKYSGHVFSANPALRMIMIDSAIVREGDLVTTDINLVEITEEGLIMNFKGTEFRVKLF